MTSLDKAKHIAAIGSCVIFDCDHNNPNECPCYDACEASMSRGQCRNLTAQVVITAMEYVEKETTVETIAPETRVYVSDVSVFHALEERKIRLYVCPSPDGKGHYCVSGVEDDENSFKGGLSNVRITHWDYVVPYTTTPAKEMTIEEIQKELGYKIKVVE